MHYTVKKSGKLTLRPAEGNLCGLSPTSKRALPLEYEFEVSVYKLDDRKFVIDHFEIEDKITAWSNAARYAGSCEQVAAELAKLIASRIPPEIRRDYSPVTLTLRGTSGASITVVSDAEALIEFKTGLRAEPIKTAKGKEAAATIAEVVPAPKKKRQSYC